MPARRWPRLDGLRGVAILLVLVAHAQIVGAAAAGMVGVTLFFVLSGFLITYLLLDELALSGRIRLSAFYWRRAARLLPALAFYLTGFAVLDWVLHLGQPVWDSTWPAAFYVSNYVQILGHDLYTHQHTWSLAVEEHFYLIWPLLVILGATRKLRLLAIVVVSLVVWRIGAGLVDPEWAYKATDTNAYALGFGCLLAVVHRRGWSVTLPHRTAEVGVIVMVLLSLVPARDLEHLYEIGVWLPLLAAVASGACVLASVESSPAFLNGKTVRWFGGISYSLYLWHVPLLGIPGLAETRWTRIAAIALSITVAWFSWKVVEQPILRSNWRQRLMSPGQENDLVPDLPVRPVTP